MGDIELRVVPPPERAGELAGEPLLEKFEKRVDELGQGIGEIANSLRARLESQLAEEHDAAWKLDVVSVTFSLDLEAEAGVVVAKAKTSAGFEVSLEWKKV